MHKGKTIPQLLHVHSVPSQISKMERFAKSEAVN